MDDEQKKRFEEAARELKCDEDEEKFNANLRRIVPTKPESEKDRE